MTHSLASRRHQRHRSPARARHTAQGRAPLLTGGHRHDVRPPRSCSATVGSGDAVWRAKTASEVTVTPSPSPRRRLCTRRPAGLTYAAQASLPHPGSVPGSSAVVEVSSTFPRQQRRGAAFPNRVDSAHDEERSTNRACGRGRRRVILFPLTKRLPKPAAARSERRRQARALDPQRASRFAPRPPTGLDRPCCSGLARRSSLRRELYCESLPRDDFDREVGCWY